MTSPYVATTTPRHEQPWRIILVALTCLLSPPAAVIAGFAGYFFYSDCIFECTPGSGDHLGGGLLLLLAVARLVAGPVMAWLLLRRWLAVALAAAGVVAVLVTGTVIVGAN